VAHGEAPALEARQLTKRYDDLVAVNRVDLVVPAGSVFGLLGPNGAGKTTLMRMAFGLIRPDGGTIVTFGRSFASDGFGALEGVAGFVETPRFYPYLSGRENLRILQRLDGRDTPPLVGEALEKVDLTARARDRVRTYYGMVQRLGLAAALLREPRLLVVDEPTNGLDPAGIREMRSLIRDLADTRLTVLLSSHNMLEVAELCDRVAIMSHGRIVFGGTMDELRAQAPEPVYVASTSDNARAFEVAAAAPGVTDVTVDGRGLAFSAGSSAVHELTRAFGRAGVGISHLAARETPLETLFFKLTGHGDLYDESHPGTAVAA
jgi:ABC-2 type transport system ATP-binding protein